MAYGGGFIDAFGRCTATNPAQLESPWRGTIPQLSHVGR
jgi:hypothetical protein